MTARPRSALRHGLTLLLACVGVDLAAGGERDFFPVVAASGADPWVIRHDGWYYMTATTGTNVTLWRSATLSGIGGGETKVIWSPPAKGPNSKNVWAPELHRLGGKWYVYYAADDGENANHRMYVLENAAADPFTGEFVSKGKIADPKADRWAIDGTVLTLKGKRYFIWSGWEGTKDVRQDLYIAPMENPWTLSGPRVEISRPTHDWETVGTPTVNEGPQVLVRDDTAHVVYSASGSWTDDYCLGLLTLKAGGDPLDPRAWAKRPKPVFRGGNGVVSPGHCCFVKSPDGKEDWLVYHAARHKGAGWARNLRMQRFDWNKDDTPKFGEPASADQLITLPGGDPDRTQYAGKGDTAEIVVEAKKAGPYTLTVRYANNSARKGGVHAVKVNGTAAGEIEYPFTDGGWSAAVVRVDLKAGANTIVLTGKMPGAVIDGVDLAPDK
jgi:GH43 family beta-xylosidase